MCPIKNHIAATADSMAGCNHPETTLKPVSQHALLLQVTVTACEMLAEEGSGGSLYTAYLVEARSNLLQPSWIVRRRFRSLTLLPT